MRKILASLFALTLSLGFLQAQTDTMYIIKAGNVVGRFVVNTQVDSVIFYKPNLATNSLNITYANIPAGTFTMGSPTDEIDRFDNEVQHTVTLRAFSMSTHEISNSQYAAFLNAKNIGNNGEYAEGVYPLEILVSPSTDTYNWGLHYTAGQWVPVEGAENNPVINVTWFGAMEFARYAGGTLPTEAQWEYACRAGTTTPFNTGDCLSNEQANYDWLAPYGTCVNPVSNAPLKTQPVGTYSANAFGLFDMHGNVFEWCSDLYGTYPTEAQTNPTGATTGSKRVIRGGSWNEAHYCRSAFRAFDDPSDNFSSVGFRVVLVP